MGIRYYAYAFSGDQTDKVLADPLTVIGPDPLADALGLEPGFTVGVTGLKQSQPERDFLYLDKAWSQLQRITAPRPSGGEARVAYRMFEGQVSYSDGGFAWHPWVRVVAPDEVALIDRDLATISDRDIEAGLNGLDTSAEAAKSELDYAAQHLHRAKVFVHVVASAGRGFVYMIG